MKNGAETYIKMKEVLNKLGKIANTYMRDSQFTIKDGTLLLHPAGVTHWFSHKEKYFDFYGFPP